MKPGIYPGLSFEDYCAIPAINKSGLDLIADSPLHYWAGYLDPNRERDEPTPALKLGQAIHTKFLEPALFNARYAVVPDDAPKRPSVTQLNAKKPSPETIDAIGWWENFNQKNEGKTVLTKDQLDTCERVALSVSKSAAARELLQGGQSEVTLVWEKLVTMSDGTEVQVPCKARVDYLSPVAMLDVKSTQSAAPAAFAKSVASYRYHVQAAFYSDGAMALGLDLPFVFLAFETSSPYACAFYLADEEMKKVGRRLYLPLVEKYAECIQSGEWPGYSDEIRTLALPVWATKEYSPCSDL